MTHYTEEPKTQNQNSYFLVKQKYETAEESRLSEIFNSLPKSSREKAGEQKRVKLYEILDDCSFKEKSKEFVRLMETYKDRFYNCIYKYIGREYTEDVNDFYQEIALKLWKEFPSYKFLPEYDDPFWSWAYKRAHGAVVNNLKKYLKQKRNFRVGQDEEENFNNIPAGTSEDSQFKEHSIKLLTEAIDLLPLHLKSVMKLKMDGRTNDEIIIQLSINKTTIKDRITSANKLLLESLKDLDLRQYNRIKAASEFRMKDRKEISKKVTELRKFLNLSPWSFALTSGISQQAYLRAECNLSLPAQYIDKIKNTFNLSEEDILAGNFLAAKEVIDLNSKMKAEEKNLISENNAAVQKSKVQSLISFREQQQISRCDFWKNIGVKNKKGYQIETCRNCLTRELEETIESFYKFKLSGSVA